MRLGDRGTGVMGLLIESWRGEGSRVTLISLTGWNSVEWDRGSQEGRLCCT